MLKLPCSFTVRPETSGESDVLYFSAAWCAFQLEIDRGRASGRSYFPREC